jgi:peptidoglycan/xylan/chitin deacetylase (PgdA/CDA1 family)
MQCHAGGPNVVLTFDDGYADNLYEASPLLQEAECPATIFVTTGKIGDDKEFWWDELDRIIFNSPKLPRELSVTIHGHSHCWNMETTGQETERDGWHVLLKQKSTPRQAAYIDLCRLLKSVGERERSWVLAELCDWAGMGPLGRPSHRSLTAPELCSLAAIDLIEIGSHTVTHPQLSGQSASIQRDEIEKSKAILETVVGRPVQSFSYPFGGVGDFSLETIRLVSHAGYDRACANYPGFVSGDTDRYQLPRFVVRNWDGDQFAKTVDQWMSS